MDRIANTQARRSISDTPPESNDGRLSNATVLLQAALWQANHSYPERGPLCARKRCCANEIRAWGFNPDEYVLFLGRFSPEKNCNLLIEAFGRLNTKVDLVLAGGGDPSSVYAQGLRRQAGRNVHFLDYASGDAFEELLTNAMLLVLPSDLEGLSLALLEAMGAGVCVLASDIPENREVVEGAGFLFRAGDVDYLESKFGVEDQTRPLGNPRDDAPNNEFETSISGMK